MKAEGGVMEKEVGVEQAGHLVRDPLLGQIGPLSDWPL